MSKFSNIMKAIDKWLPYIIEDEMKRRDVERKLKAQLQGYTAWGETQKGTLEAGTAEQIIQNLFHPDYFKRRNLPAQEILSYVNKVYPGLIQEKGIQVPEDINQQVDEVNEALTRKVIATEAQEPMREEDIRTISKFVGEEPLREAATEYVKGKEAAKERALRERALSIEENLVPIREKETAARWKEIEGQIGDMTGKQARDALFDLQKQRWSFTSQLDKGLTLAGVPLGETEKANIRENIREIRGLESRMIKTVPALRKEYEELIKELKQKNYNFEDLTKDQKLIDYLLNKGYNIEAVKSIFK